MQPSFAQCRGMPEWLRMFALASVPLFIAIDALALPPFIISL